VNSDDNKNNQQESLKVNSDNNKNILLKVDDLYKHFTVTKGVLKKATGTVKAVDGVSFYIKKGETLALVGESGSGKTTTGRCIMRAIEATSGSISFNNLTGEGKTVDIMKLDRKRLIKFRRHMGMVFQDPFASLNPRLKISDIVGEPFINHRICKNKKELQEKVADLLRTVKLSPKYMNRYPHAFSGGQRQRIAIARALALKPEFIVADEPVSALDVSVQVQILNLLKDLQEDFNLTYLFVAHNLAVVEYISNRVAVMYVGKIVELANTEELFSSPKHPYTEALLSAVPEIDTRRNKQRILLKGEIADPANTPGGCFFHPRCSYARDICKSKEPKLLSDQKGSNPHYVSCHFADKLKLAGIK